MISKGYGALKFSGDTKEEEKKKLIKPPGHM